MGPAEQLPAQKRRLSPKREATFPNLAAEGYEVTSDEESDYNCTAWAAHRQDKRWWPVEGIDGVYWPPDAPLEETVEAFRIAYRIDGGYTPCEDGTLEPGFEKIAIYAKPDGEPTHAARLLPSGQWTSKLGGWEDISHNTLRALEGAEPAYGSPVAYLKRPLPAAATESVSPPPAENASPQTR